MRGPRLCVPWIEKHEKKKSFAREKKEISRNADNKKQKKVQNIPI